MGLRPIQGALLYAHAALCLHVCARPFPCIPGGAVLCLRAHTRLRACLRPHNRLPTWHDGIPCHLVYTVG